MVICLLVAIVNGCLLMLYIVKSCLIADCDLFACCHSKPVPVAMVNQCLLYIVKYCLIADGDLFACCHSDAIPVAMVNYCCKRYT